MKTLGLALIVAAALLAGAPAEVCAQTPRPERPNRGLFGKGYDSVNTDQLLTMTTTIGGGYDANVLAVGGEGAGPTTPGVGRPSSTGQGSLRFAYSFTRSRLALSAGAGGSASYYPAILNRAVTSRQGNFSGSLRLTRRLRLTGGISASYQPNYFLFMPAFILGFDQAGEPLIIDQTLGAVVETHRSIASAVGLSQQLSRRVALSVDYGDSRSDASSQERDLRTQSVGGHVSVTLAKGMALRLGYSQSEATFGAGDTLVRSRTRNIDIGIDLNRALSLTRRTTVSYGTGITGVDDGARTQYHLIGNARLTRELGRTWNASLGYSRNVSYLETFRAPVFADSASVGAGGLLGRRFKFQASLGAAKGEVGASALNGFTTTFGTTSLTVGLARVLAVGINYSYYRYQFESGISLPEGLPRRTDRQSVQAFVTLLTPIFHHTRKPDASR